MKDNYSIYEDAQRSTKIATNCDYVFSLAKKESPRNRWLTQNKVVIIGGGTFNPVRNHLSIAAPAFGSTAKRLTKLLLDMAVNAELVLTKMADSRSGLMSNDDVSNCIDGILADRSVSTIVMSVALCDYKASYDGVEGDFHGERLQSRDGDITLDLTPADKLISRIKEVRPDIFLVGFKTTTNKSLAQQNVIAKSMVVKTGCDVVFANDTVKRVNVIVRKGLMETHSYGDRVYAEEALANIISNENRNY